MQVTSELNVHEIDGSADGCGVGGPKLKIASHWNYNGTLGFVVITTPDGKSYTVSRRDIDKATSACTDLPK